MAQLFISHADVDGKLAGSLAEALEQMGYTTWYYERDCVPGLSYLLQTGQAIKDANAFIIIISKESLASPQVSKEVVRAHEEGKSFLPLLQGLTHIEFQRQQHEWREAMGAATSVSIPVKGVLEIIRRVELGLIALKIHPEQKTEPIGLSHTKIAEPYDDAELPSKMAAKVLQDELALYCAGENMRVVYVEDEDVEKTLMERHLKSLSIDVQTACNANDGIMIVNKFNPHLIITDIVMPDRSGEEMLKAIRGTHCFRSTPFLMVTVFAEYNDAARFIDPLTYYLPKPFSASVLFNRMALLLKKTRELRQSNANYNAQPNPVEQNITTIHAADVQTLRESECIFTDQCQRQLKAMNLTEPEIFVLVEGEFRSHTNYFRYDLENYPLPLQSGYIIYINKAGKRIEFTGLVKCTANQAKLTSWSNVLALYRRASRLAYRNDPQKVLLHDGALHRAAATHADLRTRIIKHFTSFEGMPVEDRIMQLGFASDPVARTSKDVMTDEIAFHIQESVRADEEAVNVAHALEAGDLEIQDATGAAVMELERSLQHLHKVITAFPPIS